MLEPVILVTCRSRLNLISTIRERISNTPWEALFRKTCFGWFLDLDDWPEDCIIIHFMLGRQVKCLGGETDIIPFSYHIVDKFEIQFGRKEFCLVTGLSFGVEYSADYNNEDDPIPFRRRVFSSAIDGKPITGTMLESKIKSEKFYRLNDHDAVSLCCVAILQFVLLGLEDRWAHDYYKRERRYPRVVAWRAKKKFFRNGFPQGGPSSFPTQPSPSYFEGAQATPSYVHNMATSNWKTPMPSHPGTSNWRSQMPSHSATPNWQTLSRRILMMLAYQPERKEVRPSMYRRTPYMDLPPTTVLPKKRGGDDVMIMGERETGNYFVYENVDLSYLVPDYFWRQLVPHLYMDGIHSLERPNQEGWLFGDGYMPINAGGNHWVTGAVNLP
nr:phospholipase-like protein [Tanacetum cinerariifolium]